MKTVLIAPDIFGVTEPLLELIEQLDINPILVDPYQNQTPEFKSEAQAYDYFISHVGLEKYSQLIQDKMSGIKRSLPAIGFSIGGSAIWQLSQQFPVILNKAMCFYSSQIRHMTNIDPHFPVELVLPENEHLFSIEQLISKLKSKPNTILSQTEHLHGFMNRLSKNYNEAAYHNYQKHIQLWMR